jgi:non-heme chloroperoxidase
MSAPFVPIGAGHQLFVRDWGTGAPVVLLSGWAMDSRVWGETMVALNDQGLRTIAYDRRGHGRSTDPGVSSLDVLADDLNEVLKAMNLRDVTLVTHSGGAIEAIRYLSRYGTDRISRLIMVGATGPYMLASDDNPDAIPREVFDFVLNQLAQEPARWIDENAEPFAPGANKRVIDWLGMMILDTSRRAMVDFQKIIAQTDSRAEAVALKLPVTIIHGDCDASAPIDLTARRYHAIIPNCELLVYEGVAHGVMVTHPIRLANDIAQQVPR